MSDLVQVAMVTAIPPTLAVLLQWWQQWRAAKKAREELEKNKAEAIAAREKLESDVQKVHVLVNSKSERQEAKVDRQTEIIEALTKEVTRLNDGASNTPAPTTVGQQPPVTLNGEGNIRVAEQKEAEP